MNDFRDLEAELKRLRPRATSPELTSRIESALAQETSATPTAGVLPRRRKFQLNWFSVGVGAAAAAALVIVAMLGINPKPQTQQHSIDTSPTQEVARAEAKQPQLNGSFVPDGLTRVVYHTRDEGLVYRRQDQAPVRRVRSRARETLHWREPSTGASLRVSYPTEEVKLIPVGSQ